jgi:hypothetical protein
LWSHKLKSERFNEMKGKHHQSFYTSQWAGWHSCNDLSLYSGGILLKSRQHYQLSWSVSWLSSVPTGEYCDSTLKEAMEVRSKLCMYILQIFLKSILTPFNSVGKKSIIHFYMLVSENKISRNNFGTIWKEVTGIWRKFRNEKLYKSLSLSRIVRIVISRRMTRVGYVVSWKKQEMHNTFCFGNLTTWELNFIEICLRWREIIQARVHWWVSMKMVINLQVI